MTRLPTPIILTCPHCRNEAPSISPSSTNNFGWTQWSDGWGEGQCSRTQSGLLYCSTCRYVFQEASCEWRHANHTKSGTEGTLKNNRLGMFLGFGRIMFRSAASDWASIFRGRTELKELCKTYGQQSKRSASDALSDGRWLGEKTEYLLRLQWWWDWNHIDRWSAPSAEMALSFGHSPSPSPTMPADVIDNLERLLPLLDPAKDKLFAGEILRRLERFKDAEECFHADRVARAEWRTVLAKLSASKVSCIVELPMPEWGAAGNFSVK